LVGANVPVNLLQCEHSLAAAFSRAVVWLSGGTAATFWSYDLPELRQGKVTAIRWPSVRLAGSGDVGIKLIRVDIF